MQSASNLNIINLRFSNKYLIKIYTYHVLEYQQNPSISLWDIIHQSWFHVLKCPNLKRCLLFAHQHLFRLKSMLDYINVEIYPNFESYTIISCHKGSITVVSICITECFVSEEGLWEFYFWISIFELRYFSYQF